MGNPERDLAEIMEMAEGRMGAVDMRRRYRGCGDCAGIQVRNAFQVFRHAIREWALVHGEGEALKALMYSADSAREVKSNITEMTILCEDSSTAEKLGRVLEAGGYEEEA